MRPLAIGLGILATLLVGAVGLYRVSLRSQVPPALEAESCGSTPPVDERPNARVLRKGGQTTRYPKVWRQDGALMVDNVAQSRDLGRYETLHLISPPMTVVESQTDPALARARTFLWEHWKAHKRGYLILTASSVDATATSHVFVEPDNIGRWRVSWRIVRRREVDDTPTDYSMAWVIPGEWDRPGTPLAQGQQPDPLRHRLEFRDVCGDIDGGF